jgi:hypothetical protein
MRADNPSTERSNMSTVTATDDAIFDAQKYDLPIPRLDGHKADNLSIAFSGGVSLDRTSEEDLDLVEMLTLGQEINLRITATVTKKGFTFAAGKEDSPETTGYGVGLKVHSLEVA